MSSNPISQESFADLFEASLARQEMRQGEVITAEVVRIDQNFVVVNAGLNVVFGENSIRLAGEDVGDAIRHEEISSGASQVAALPAVRSALLFRQRMFRQAPGLVADGRDMGSVVFPDAQTKVFLTASVEVRAERRYKQLIEKGIAANILPLLLDLRERDERDSQRSVAPLQQNEDARLLDTTSLNIDNTVAQVLDWSRKAL